MALIDHIDGPSRDIYLSADTVGTTIDPIDIYREMRALRRTDESLRKYEVFLKAYGNVDKGGGKATERYVVCIAGTRIVPYDTSHELGVHGTIITDDGQEGFACFDRSGLSATTVVDINYNPPQVEVITVTTGSGLDPTQSAQLTTIYNLLNVIESGYDHRDAMRIILSALAGKASVNGNNVSFRDLADSLDRIVATTTAGGGRTAVTLNTN